MIKNSVKVVSMDSGNNHSQNIPVRAEYERQITPIITFIWGQPGSRLMEQAKVRASDTVESKQASISDKHSIRTWDLIIYKTCLCFLFCKVDREGEASYCDIVSFKIEKAP